MPIYAYRARDGSGQLAEGTIEVASEADLAHRLDSQGLLLTTARKVRKTRTRRARLRFSRKELITFTCNLDTIYSSGVPVVSGLEDLAGNAGNKATAAVASAIAADIRAGSSMAGAMRRHPQIFPGVFVSVVEAGESAGEAGPVLRRLAGYYQWMHETRANALRALTYPFVLLVAVAGLVVLLLTFLVPRVLNVLTRLNAELPTPTKVLMAVSNFIRGNAVLLGACCAGIVIGYAVLRRTERGRLLIDRWKLGIPVAGPLMSKLAAARFVSTISTLYRAGIGTIESLQTAENVVGNAWIAKSVREARERVTQGESIASALRAAGGFEPLVVRMISLGEQTGTLGESLDHVTAFYDREVPQTIKGMMSLLEPALIILAGLSVAFILVCTFLPIFQMAGSLHR